MICREKVLVPDSKPYISFIGDENRTDETVLTWNNKASDKDKDGCELGTYRSASVTIESDFFCATGITIEVQLKNCFPNLTVLFVFDIFSQFGVILQIRLDLSFDLSSFEMACEFLCC